MFITRTDWDCKNTEMKTMGSTKRKERMVTNTSTKIANRDTPG